MPRIRLIHWNAEEAPERAEKVRALGHEMVEAGPLDGPSLRTLRANPPAAVLIDLSRLPSHGREVAVALRKSKATRLIPLVFLEGTEDKVRAVQQALPDARYTNYAKLGPVLEDVLRDPPKEVVVPKSISGVESPLAKKLGLKEGEAIAVVNGMQVAESRLPEYALREGVDPELGMHLWFVRSEKELRGAIEKMAKVAQKSALWILWPKLGGGLVSDLNGNKVRAAALEKNLVDFKICAFDETWSGMRFAVKRRTAK